MPRTDTPPRAPATSPSPRVVHTYCREATSWDFVNGWYGDHVSQVHVSRMVDLGLMALAGTASRAADRHGVFAGRSSMMAQGDHTGATTRGRPYGEEMS